MKDAVAAAALGARRSLRREDEKGGVQFATSLSLGAFLGVRFCKLWTSRNGEGASFGKTVARAVVRSDLEHKQVHQMSSSCLTEKWKIPCDRSKDGSAGRKEERDRERGSWKLNLMGKSSKDGGNAGSK